MFRDILKLKLRNGNYISGTHDVDKLQYENLKDSP
jgi:hypothetical protein